MLSSYIPLIHYALSGLQSLPSLLPQLWTCFTPEQFQHPGVHTNGSHNLMEIQRASFHNLPATVQPGTNSQLGDCGQ